jgi:hypothetical protein
MAHDDIISCVENFIRGNIVEISQEILDWRGSGILKEGKIRRADYMLSGSNIPYPDRLRVLEEMSTNIALEFIINNYSNKN